MTKPKQLAKPAEPKTPADCPLNPEWKTQKLPIYVGIDPGKTGAVGVVFPDGTAAAWRSPVVKQAYRSRAKKGKHKGEMRNRTRDLVDEMGMAALVAQIFAWRKQGYTVCWAIERQQAMPFKLKGMTQGASSTMNLGINYGLWLGILAAFKWKPVRIQPGTWKPTLNLSQDKSVSRRLCHHTYDLDVLRDVDTDRAEAVLLAHYFKHFHVEKQKPASRPKAATATGAELKPASRSSGDMRTPQVKPASRSKAATSADFRGPQLRGSRGVMEDRWGR